MSHFFRQFCLIKPIVPVTLMIIALFAFSGCDSDSDSGSGSAASYSVYLYDENLELRQTVPAGEGALIDLDAKSAEFENPYFGWYEAGSDTELTGIYSVPGDIALYASPSVAEIGTEEDLIKIKDDLAGRYILKNDIALSSEWVPLGESGTGFSGILNGRGYKITGLRIDALSDGEDIGLFGYIEDGTVKNLGVETADKGIEGRSNVGVIAGQLLGGRIENCYTAGNINIILTGSNAGGIAGSVSADAVIINSHSTVSVYSAGADYIGGIAGQISGSATVEECYSAGDLRGARYVGGIAGETAGNVTIVKSRYTGDISGTSELGGIVGSASGTVITDSYSAGSVIGSGTIIGGIVGRSSSSLEITRSHSVAYLASSAANSYVGGIVGNVPSGAAVISGSYFAGMIRATGLSGGIAGSLGGSGTGSKIENCFSSGYIFSTGGSSIGGIAGQISGIVSVTKNYFTGTVNTADTGSVGGLIGYIQSSTTVAVTDNILASPAIYNTGSGTAKNRLVGNIAVGATRTVIGNLAYDGIDTVGAFTNTTDEENHGTDAALEDLTARSTYTGIQQWAFGDDDEHPWKWGAFSDYPYPTLYWQTERP